MSLISGAMKSISSGLLNVGKTAVQAVAPKVTDLLKSVVGDAFDALKGQAQKLAGNLPGPLGKLAQSLIGQGFDSLKQLAGDALGKELQSLVSRLAPKSVIGAPQGTSVTAPAIGTAAGTAARATAASAALAALGASRPMTATEQLAALKEPAMPPPGASPGELIRYQANLQKYQAVRTILIAGAAAEASPAARASAAEQLKSLKPPVAPPPGASPGQLIQYQANLQKYQSLRAELTAIANGGPQVPGLQPPVAPPPGASQGEMIQYQVNLQKYEAARAAASAGATAQTTGTNGTAPTAPANNVVGLPAASGQSTEDSLGAQAAALKEPAAPPEGATEGQMIEYQKNLQKYARMMDMLSKLIQAKNDMQKGLIANFRV